MNWKKLLLIAIVAAGFGFASAPRSQAGISVGIGFGGPSYGYGYGNPGYGYGYGYPGYYGYGRQAYYPYGYGYASRGYRGYYSPSRVVVRRHYHRHNGRRFACTDRHRRWR